MLRIEAYSVLDGVMLRVIGSVPEPADILGTEDAGRSYAVTIAPETLERFGVYGAIAMVVKEILWSEPEVSEAVWI